MSEYPASWTSLKYPWRRRELIAYLDELSDPEYQKAEWFNYSAGGVAGVDPVYHFFFDDTDLGEEPSKELGVSLLAQREVDVLLELSGVLQKLLKRLGDADSAAYISDPAWTEVISIARKARAMIS